MPGVRLLLPVLLAVVVGGAVFTAVRVDAETAPVPGEYGGVTTPVLSARRVPELLAAPVADRRLRAALDELLTRVPGTVCLTVNAAGRAVYAANPAVPLIPGSLEKLLVATVALDVLGPDTTFRTRVVAAAPAVDGVVDGDLYLVGGGDPLLATDPYQARFKHQPQTVTDFEALADAVVAAGVTDVRGAVVGDASRYDDTRYVDAWPDRFITQDQSGPLSALTVNDAWVTFPPNPDAMVPDETPAGDPAVHAAGLLRDLLTARGVTVAEVSRRGSPPGDVVDLVAFQSPPMREVVAEMLRESDNQTAELLVKEIGVATGGDGSTAAGMAAIRSHLAGLGLRSEGSVAVDGSGLADGNRLSCQLLHGVLDRAGATSAIAAGLPVAGQSGTLTERFVDSPATGRMRAKTGTLNQVTALAGFVDTLPGAALSFAYVVNLPPGQAVGADDFALQDELAGILLSYPAGPALADLGPLPVPAS